MERHWGQDEAEEAKRGHCMGGCQVLDVEFGLAAVEAIISFYTERVP